MAKQLQVFVLVALSLALTCTATTYVVGDNSGWDISTDLDSWAKGKTFFVGDVLLFQFSSSNSLEEVTKENFNNCNTTNVLKSYTNGNTTVTLSKPGPRYFISGNKLYCLGGMKLQLNVKDNNQEYSPAGAPLPADGSNQGGDALPRPSTKSNVPISSGVVHGGWHALVSVCLGFMVTVLWVVQMI
ncbi:stellacyanin [Juglans microcarpa x Juglans regia]|uniref:stellacyanin n=1 Tax=Juglans microcarpa x Juglans regia TaxID=2249226 RepID=UPI001B7DCB51|nr:stellacyanin [Juglans microcarpa x Juglans regia]